MLSIFKNLPVVIFRWNLTQLPECEGIACFQQKIFIEQYAHVEGDQMTWETSFISYMPYFVPAIIMYLNVLGRKTAG